MHVTNGFNINQNPVTFGVTYWLMVVVEWVMPIVGYKVSSR
jgi:hypothetical protein